MTPIDENKMDNLIKLQEGLRLKPYTDTTGNLSIGYGRNLTRDGISQAEATMMFQDDVASVERELSLNAPWYTQLNDARQSVLINITYNEGIGGLMQFKDMLRALEAGNFEEASKQLLDSLADKQLPSRYNKLAYILETGIL